MGSDEQPGAPPTAVRASRWLEWQKSIQLLQHLEVCKTTVQLIVAMVLVAAYYLASTSGRPGLVEPLLGLLGILWLLSACIDSQMRSVVFGLIDPLRQVWVHGENV